MDTLIGLLEPLIRRCEFILHIARERVALSTQDGAWTYAILFLIVFCETGLVVTPFLPGASLLFAAGALAAVGAFDPVLVTILLMAAAISGDSVNYAIGNAVGTR